tara:strand:- start:374 stop:1363 length:990 start_codon:yes stop_codon:yes gene_type:complete
MKRQKLVNLLFEEDAKFNDIYGDAQSTKYGESPADKVAAQGESGAGNEFLKLGDGAKDKVKAGGTFGPVAAKQLKASQAEVLFPKAIKFAAGFLKGDPGFKPEGDIGGIITKDKQILDGHHRWAGAYIVNPDSKLAGTEIDMGWKEAIPVLRAIGIAFGHKTGNAANDSESVWGSAGELSLEDFGKLFVNAVINKNGGWENQKGVPKYLGSEFSDYDSTNEEHQKKLISKLYENYMKLRKEGAPPSGMPSRIDMPVLVAGEGSDDLDSEGNLISQANTLGADEVEAATHLLSKGAIDVKPNYNDKLKKVAANESIDLQRWNKLAGLIKG